MKKLFFFHEKKKKKKKLMDHTSHRKPRLLGVWKRSLNALRNTSLLNVITFDIYALLVQYICLLYVPYECYFIIR